MTAEERIEALHRRMAALSVKRERRKTAALTAGCAALAACLIMLIFGESHECGVAGAYTGATLLFEDAGGYVLAAVLAFFAGVIVTALCVRYRAKRGSKR